jgi:acid stress chaperone HdeA
VPFGGLRQKGEARDESQTGATACRVPRTRRDSPANDRLILVLYDAQQYRLTCGRYLRDETNPCFMECFMKPAKVLLILICIASAQAASAQEKKVSPLKMSCTDYVAVDEMYRPALIYWVAGVDKLGIKETDTIVVDTAHPVSETVAEACTKDPQAPFVSKVRSMIKAKKISLFDHT